jgi:hypothetical protein
LKFNTGDDGPAWTGVLRGRGWSGARASSLREESRVGEKWGRRPALSIAAQRGGGRLKEGAMQQPRVAGGGGLVTTRRQQWARACARAASTKTGAGGGGREADAWAQALCRV